MKKLFNILNSIAGGESFSYTVSPGETQALTASVTLSSDQVGYFSLHSTADLTIGTSGYLYSQQDPFMIYLRNSADDILSLQISRSGETLIVKGFSVNS